MSIHEQLKQCLTSVQVTETGMISLEFLFPDSFLGFQGHFPDDPILPGVCLIQGLRLGLEQAWKMPLRVVEIANAKFISPSRPGQTLLFKVSEQGWNEGVVATKTKVSRAGERVAELSVKLAKLPPP